MCHPKGTPLQWSANVVYRRDGDWALYRPLRRVNVRGCVSSEVKFHAQDTNWTYALKASISLYTMIGKRCAYTIWYEDRQVMIRFENYRNHNFFCATCHTMCQPMYRSEELAQHFLYWNMQAHHCDDAALSGSVEQLPELQAFHTSNSSQPQHLKPISVVQSVQKQDERHN